MAKLKDIKGTNIQFLDADPVEYVGTWSSGGNMNTGRRAGHGTGITTAALAAGGQTGPGGNVTVNSEQYNGTAWTETNNLNTARYGIGSFGTGAAAIAASGYVTTIQTAVESWNGTSWTEVAELNVSRFYSGGSKQGTSTAGIIFGGSDGSPEDKTEIWNGSAWTEVNNLPTVRTYPAGMGTSTAALSTGAFQSPGTYPNSTDQWDGTNWTNLSVTQNTTRSVASTINAGSTTSALLAGGQSPGAVANTETWDGSSWTEVNDLATANETIIGAGTSSSDAWGSGGDSIQTTTEEWAFPGPTSTILQEGLMWFNSASSALKVYGRYAVGGAWASGGNMNNANAAVGSFGTSTAAIEFGGYYPPGSAPGRITTEEYNGTSWTEKNDMSTYRAERPGAGTTAAGLAIRGNPGNATAVESWDGTNWSTVNSSNTPNGGNSACGTFTAAITFGGETTANTEKWNGAAWTETADMNTGRGKMSGSGTQTSAIGSGGTPGPGVLSESWNGTSWSEVAEINTSRSAGAAGGTSNSSALAFGGGPSRTANTELWNGTAWTEVANLSTATQDMNYGNVGSTGGTLAIGGDPSPSPVSTRTEEWTADNAVLTVTTS